MKEGRPHEAGTAASSTSRSRISTRKPLAGEQLRCMGPPCIALLTFLLGRGYLGRGEDGDLELVDRVRVRVYLNSGYTPWMA